MPFLCILKFVYRPNLNQKSNGWELDTFENSVPMSSYLVAFVVSDFESIRKNSSKYNIKVEVYAKAESINKGHCDFALDEASRILDFYTDYFNVKYPLVKSSNF